jgi:hypothetical protein
MLGVVTGGGERNCKEIPQRRCVEVVQYFGRIRCSHSLVEQSMAAAPAETLDRVLRNIALLETEFNVRTDRGGTNVAVAADAEGMDRVLLPQPELKWTQIQVIMNNCNALCPRYDRCCINVDLIICIFYI